MKTLLKFLETSYTAYQATENAAALLLDSGYRELRERDIRGLEAGGKYFVRRGGSSLIAFRLGKKKGKGMKIVACHTDSPCFKLKEHPALKGEGCTRLNTEPYGGGLWYTFFDRPLRLAGRVIRERDGALVAENYVSDFTVTLPSLAVHMQRNVNENGFVPDLQTDLPLLGLGEAQLGEALESAVSYDLFAAVDEKPRFCGRGGELLSSPRLDDLSGACGALEGFLAAETEVGVNVLALLDSEEIGSRTRQGAGGDFLRNTLRRISAYGCEGEFEDAASASFLLSLDNAHALHPNHPEKCDPTNRPLLGGGIVIKGHAGGAYTTDALSSAALKTIFTRAGVKFQSFYNRSDMRSGGTLGAISLGQVSVLSADIGLAQLAMHSAVETLAAKDYLALKAGIVAFYGSALTVEQNRILLG